MRLRGDSCELSADASIVSCGAASQVKLLRLGLSLCLLVALDPISSGASSCPAVSSISECRSVYLTFLTSSVNSSRKLTLFRGQTCENGSLPVKVHGKPLVLSMEVVVGNNLVVISGSENADALE